MNPLSAPEWLQCIACSQTFPLTEVRYHCTCSGLLEVQRTPAQWLKISRPLIEARRLSHKDEDISGVWRFREGVLGIPLDSIVTHPEGGTHLYQRRELSQWAQTDELWFKHEGENPTGSFKDRGMTVAVSMAKFLGKKFVACASTGNTSASLAAYASQAKIQGVVFIPQGKISMGKLAQAVGYGSKILSIRGDFDKAMDLVQKAATQLELYMVNSLNPFRIEGQKTIVWEILEQLRWNAPDWLVLPAGNLGNTSAFGKAIKEALLAGWIKHPPKIASIQAAGASPFYKSYVRSFASLEPMTADTIASAIRIGNPVNWTKARDCIQNTQGVVTSVTDAEILEAKMQIDRSGLGCEPASAASLAGLRKLRREGVIPQNARVVCTLTGHILKDTDIVLKQHQNPKESSESPGEGSSGTAQTIEPTIDAVAKALGL